MRYSIPINLIKENIMWKQIDFRDYLNANLDSAKEYEMLKLELGQNLDNQLVLEAIIGNYKKRIELIENLLHQINNSKQTTSKDEYIL